MKIELNDEEIELIQHCLWLGEAEMFKMFLFSSEIKNKEHCHKLSKQMHQLFEKFDKITELK